MNTLFEINEMRTVSEAELVYTMTQSKKLADDGNYSEHIDIDSIIDSMTPGRRSVARAAIELYKRSIEKRSDKKRIVSSQDIFITMKGLIGDLNVEEFWAIYLDQSGSVIKRVRIGKGGIDCTLADVRIILRYALECSATQLGIVHNHPSGNVKPSSQDIKLTRTIKNAAEIMNIRLFDHVVIGCESYYSFADEGAL